MRDFTGLEHIVDRGLVKAASIDKSAKELMGRLTTGSGFADAGLAFIPGVGTAMSAYDTVRNGVNGFNDLFHGRFKSALGNLGSMAFNGGITALDAMTLGMGGRVVGWGAKMLGRGAKALGAARAAKNLGRFAGKARMFDARVAGAIGKRLGGAAAGRYAKTMALKGPEAAKALNFTGHGVGGWMVRHPYMTMTAAGIPGSMLGGMTEGAKGMQQDAARQGAAAAGGFVNEQMRGGAGGSFRPTLGNPNSQYGRSFLGANGRPQ